MIILDTNVLSELMKPQPVPQVVAWVVLGFESDAARIFSKIAAQRRALGRPISHPDAQIASITRARRARLATRNQSDFADCGIDVIDPWSEVSA